VKLKFTDLVDSDGCADKFNPFSVSVPCWPL